MKHFLLRFLQLAMLCVVCAAPVKAAEQPVAIITQAYIELHTGPGRGYPVFHVVERGQQVTVLKQRTDWVKVRTAPQGPMETNRHGDPIPGTNTKEGWVNVDDLALAVDESGNPVVNPAPQFTDFAGQHWETGIMVGGFGGTDIVTAYTGYHLTRNLSVEVELSQNFGNYSSGTAKIGAIVHQPFPQWRFSPFFTMGGGELKTEPRSTIVSTEDRTDDVLVVGGGFRIFLSSRFLMRVQYRQFTVLTNRDDDLKVEEWKIGISAYF